MAAFLLGVIGIRPLCAADLDINGDGAVRIAMLSRPQQNGGVDASLVCADLESMVKATRPGKPVRVVLEPVAKNRTLLGWWYNPDTAADRARLLAGNYDFLLLCESDDIVRGYPELFFEGVRAISAGAAEKGARSAVVLLAKPAPTFRDKRVAALAETTYRVGDGCGIRVVPAAFGWTEALLHNRITSDSPIKARANAYLAAAGVCCELTDAKVPKAAWEADWTTKKTTEVLAVSAYDAMRKARFERHYSGPFNGVVRIETHIKKRLKIYVPSTAANDPVRQNLQFILDAAFQDWFWKTPADWYLNGFDRYSSDFDLVYADVRQMDQYLDAENYTSSSVAATNQPLPCMAVFARNPEGGTNGVDTLRNLESVLMEGYDYAKSKALVFIPYQIAWARAWQANASLVDDGASGRTNDWLSYMLANMIYTLATGRYMPTPEKAKPHLANVDHPHGYHETCARIGYDTVMQLSKLSASFNALLMRTQTYRIETENPGFVAIRLLDRPASDVRVFCAMDVPSVAALSRESLLFTPENFDIEQSLRILPATNSPSLFFHLMASAQSDDRAIDGANDTRPFLLNFDERQAVSFAFSGDSVSPETGYRVLCGPLQRPSDIVCASIVQHGVVTEELYFSHDRYQRRPVRLYPTAADYQAGNMRVLVRAASSDRRFNGRQFDFFFRVSSQGAPVPDIRVTSPAENSVLGGPAFVTARAEATPAGGVKEVAVYLGQKRLGKASAPLCSVAVEQGPPQSRLGDGTYWLWSTAITPGGLVVSSAPISFSVRGGTKGASGAD
jgi:hypothetical protein